MKKNLLVDNYSELIKPCESYKGIVDIALEFLFRSPRACSTCQTEDLDQSIKRAKSKKDYHSLAYFHYCKGWEYIISSNYLEAKVELNKAFDLFSRYEDSHGLILAYTSLGICSMNLGKTQEAFKSFKKALGVARIANDLMTTSLILAIMGQSLIDIEDLKGALKYFKEALQPEMAPENMVIIMENIACIYYVLGDSEEALSYLHEALEIAEFESFLSIRAGILSALGVIYKDLGQIDKAENILNETLKQAQNLNLSRIEAKSLLALGEIEIEKGNLELALEYLYTTFFISSLEDIRMTKIKSLKKIAYIYKEEGDWESALEYFSQYHKENEAFLDEEASKEIERIKMAEAYKEAELSQALYQQIATISQIGIEITSSLNIKEIINIIFYKINDLMDTAILCLALYNEEQAKIDLSYYTEDKRWLTPISLDLEKDNIFEMEPLKNQEIVVIGDLDKEYDKYINRLSPRSYASSKKIKSLIYMPLTVGEKIIGVLSVQSYKTHAYKEHQVEIFKALASYVTIAVENARLYDRVKYLATKDPLTNIANRSRFNSLALRELLKYKRSGRPFSLVMFDLDHFKKVNDLYGHDGGDIVLKEVAQFFEKRLRQSDFLARYGGEEFVILLPDQSLREAVKVTQRLKEELANYEIDLGNGQSYCITASFGVSEVRPSDIFVNEIIKRADLALYESKEKGRNTVSFSA